MAQFAFSGELRHIVRVATILVSYDGQSGTSRGRAMHKHYLIEQLRARGYDLISAETEPDGRIRSSPRTIAGMRAMLRCADAIYLRNAVRGWDLLLLEVNARWTHRPVVVEINAPPEETLAYGSGTAQRGRVAIRRFIFHRIARRARALICVSQALAGFVRATYPVVPELHVVPNGGLPVEHPAPGADDGRFRVVWAGNGRRPWQAADRVVEAAALLRKAIPAAETHIFGTADLPAGACPSGVVVHAPIPHAQFRNLLMRMDVALCLCHLLPKIPAGFYWSPLKLFEAMGAGLPVVGSALGQIAEVIEEGVSGFLVGDDARVAAERLCQLAADAAARRAMGAAALQRIRAAYSWEHTGQQIDAVLRSALG